MKFGVCIGELSPENLNEIDTAALCGAQFTEASFYKLSFFTSEQLSEISAYAKEKKVTLDSANGLFGEMPLFTSENDYKKAVEYIYRSFELLSITDIKFITFGSGKSRKIPDGMSVQAANEKFEALCTEVLDPLAQKYGYIIGIEPLNKEETNYINTAAFGAELVKKMNCSAVKLLVDYYHFKKENENLADIADYTDIISHLHIASAAVRCAPLPNDGEEYGYSAFFKQLKNNVSTSVNMSIEGNIPEPREKTIRASLDYLKHLYQTV